VRVGHVSSRLAVFMVRVALMLLSGRPCPTLFRILPPVLPRVAAGALSPFPASLFFLLFLTQVDVIPPPRSFCPSARTPLSSEAAVFRSLCAPPSLNLPPPYRTPFSRPLSIRPLGAALSREIQFPSFRNFPFLVWSVVSPPCRPAARLKATLLFLS